MYEDYSPIPNSPSESGLVIAVEASDTDTDAIIHLAREIGATSQDPELGEIFWIVFTETPRRVEPFTERALRSTINRRLK